MFSIKTLMSRAAVDAFAEALLVDSLMAEIRRQRPRPFAAFRGDVRKPRTNRRKINGAPQAADMRRLLAASLPPDRASNIRKLQRGLRIIARLKADQVSA